MGSKISKNGSSKNVHQSTPYSFLHTSNIQSSNETTLIKILMPFNPAFNIVRNGPTSSLAFLIDEKCLLFSCISWVNGGSELIEYVGDEPLPLGMWLDGKFGLVNLHSSELEEAPEVNCSLLDTSISYNTDHVALLTYSGHLKLWKFSNNSNLEYMDEIGITKNIVSRATSCSFSPNGKWLVIAVSSNFFTIANKNHLEVYTFDQNNIRRKRRVSIGRTYITEVITSLEFSSDSQFLALGSFARSRAKVFLMSTQNWIFLSEIGDDSISEYFTIWPAFKPLSAHLELITSTENGSLILWDTSALYNDGNHQLDHVHQIQLSNTSSLPITSSPRFSSDGNMFAIPLSDGSVIILDPATFQEIWVIPCPNFQIEFQEREQSRMPHILSATSICFSKSCSYIAVAYSGHVVAVWLLPRLHFSLKHLCRTKIISLCPSNLVHKLPIPVGLQKYLLYQL